MILRKQTKEEKHTQINLSKLYTLVKELLNKIKGKTC